MDSPSWEARPHAARAIRALVLLGPISMGCVASIVANHLIAMPSSTAAAVGRSLGIVALATAVVWSVDRYARKLLPLAALMQLSLVFPDQAPSRFRTALKSGSSRRLEKTLDDTRRHGLAKDPGDAARQVVQLIGAIGDHDRRTRGHSERVRLFADLVGEELKLSKEERQKLQWGALLHDLGKLMVPSEILNKKGKPDDEEWRILQGHPAAGMELIEPLRDFLGEWVHAIGGHHEKWDGSGYPAKLSGHAIPRAAAIVAVADSFEVMTAVRSYKKAMSLPDARAELTRCAGSHFSPEVVRAFLGISLGHLRLVAGPLAALAHLPFLGNLAQLPAAAASIAPTMASAAALPAAAMVTAAAMTVGTPTSPDALELMQTSREATAGAEVRSAGATTDGEVPDELASTDGGVSPGDGFGTAAPSGAAATATANEVVPGGSTNAVAGGTTTTVAAAAASGDGATTTEAPSTTTAGRPATTTTAAPVVTVAPTSAPPTSATPTTPVTGPPTTSAPIAAFQIRVSTNFLRLNSQNLHGASFGRGTSLYIYAPITADQIKYSYPGGSKTAKDSPYDMMGTTVLGPTAFTAPSTPGTYTVTAEAKGSGSGSGSAATTTVIATFTVT